jgi:uncharacterized protein (TIGR00266 family)
MPTMTVTGDFDPFLQVSLQQGEKIFCEQGAMVTMHSTLDLTGQMTGGFMAAITRTFATGESFFQQFVEATRGPGDILLSPQLPGAIHIVDIGSRQYCLNDGAYLAATETVKINAKAQNIGKALFGGTGGFFVMETQGTGQLAVSGFGAIMALDVTPERDVIVDNAHVLAWDQSLEYKISKSTNPNQGMVSGIINSIKSGEGLVNRFKGQGKIFVCSRNKQGFATWISSLVSSGGGVSIF